MQPRRTLLLLCIAVGALACAAVARADLVSLRPTARVAAGQQVTLADVADIEGAKARRLAAVVVAQAQDSAFELSRAEIEAELKSAGADLKELRLRGDRVVVRPLRPEARAVHAAKAVEPEPAPAAKAAVTTPAPTSIDPAMHAGEPTPLGVVSEMLRNAFADEGGRLRLLIAPEELLKLAPKPGLRHEIAARSALRADHVAFEVIALDGDEIVSRRRVKVSPRVLTDVAVASATIRRGTRLGPSDFTYQAREVEPSLVTRIAPASDVAGAQLVRGVESGAIIMADELTAAVSIRRNDRVIIRKELGLVAIEIEAIALEDGALGDMIAFERVGTPRNRGARKDETRTIRAEVIGDGRAVVRSALP